MKKINKIMSFALALSLAATVAAGTVVTEADYNEPAIAQTDADGDVEINETNFPDANFRKYVLENFDKDENTVLSEYEMDDVTEINVNDKEISTLKGIEFFYNLEDLSCKKNKITTLDISKNLKLHYLWCNENNLSDLNISNNINLLGVWCENNKLKKLDLSKNSLDTLYCDNNLLTSIDVSNQNYMIAFSCDNNNLVSIDVSQNHLLQSFRCSYNKLTSLDLSNNKELLELICENNQLKTLDVSKNSKLKYIICRDNGLNELDVSKNTSLNQLSCGGNSISKLYLGNNSALSYLECYKSKISELDLSNNTLLEWLIINNNNITELDLSHNLRLTNLNCYHTKLSSLIIGQNPAFTRIDIGDNYLTNVDFSGCVKLEHCYIDCSKLESVSFPQNVKDLDLGKGSKIKDIFYNGTIAEWNKKNVSGVPKKAVVHCSDGNIGGGEPISQENTFIIGTESGQYKDIKSVIDVINKQIKAKQPQESYTIEIKANHSEAKAISLPAVPVTIIADEPITITAPSITAKGDLTLENITLKTAKGTAAAVTAKKALTVTGCTLGAVKASAALSVTDGTYESINASGKAGTTTTLGGTIVITKALTVNNDLVVSDGADITVNGKFTPKGTMSFGAIKAFTVKNTK